jgi:hypothetical protein
MTWSYSGDPATSDVDQIRFLLGNTVAQGEGDFDLTDEEIQYCLNEQDPTNPSRVYWAAADCADQLATRYYGQSSVQKKVGDLQLAVSYAGLGDEYRRLAKRLMRGRTRYSVGAPALSDTTPAAFAMGMFDDPNSSGYIDPGSRYQ